MRVKIFLKIFSFFVDIGYSLARIGGPSTSTYALNLDVCVNGSDFLLNSPLNSAINTFPKAASSSSFKAPTKPGPFSVSSNQEGCFRPAITTWSFLNMIPPFPISNEIRCSKIKSIPKIMSYCRSSTTMNVCSRTKPSIATSTLHTPNALIGTPLAPTMRFSYSHKTGAPSLS